MGVRRACVCASGGQDDRGPRGDDRRGGRRRPRAPRRGGRAAARANRRARGVEHERAGERAARGAASGGGEDGDPLGEGAPLDDERPALSSASKASASREPRRTMKGRARASWRACARRGRRPARWRARSTRRRGGARSMDQMTSTAAAKSPAAASISAQRTRSSGARSCCLQADERIGERAVRSREATARCDVAREEPQPHHDDRQADHATRPARRRRRKRPWRSRNGDGLGRLRGAARRGRRPPRRCDPRARADRTTARYFWRRWA